MITQRECVQIMIQAQRPLEYRALPVSTPVITLAGMLAAVTFTVDSALPYVRPC
jgi:hypothetical protein